MTPEQEAALVNGGDCFSHWHSEDRRPTQDFLHGLQTTARQKAFSSNVTLTGTDDYALVSGTTQVTLPRAVLGVEYCVTNVGTDTVTVVPTGADTICGDTSVLMTVQWMSLTFKAISGGWVII